MDNYVTRLCWNENGWKKPAGIATKIENGTFNVEFGFGFEEWLFSSKFEMNGWHYGFIQGANKAQRRLASKDINVFFFTIGPDKQRYFVGEIKPCHVLTIKEADTAHSVFESDGKINQMIEDVVAVNGDADFIRDKSYIHRWALEIFNIRYNPENLFLYDHLKRVPQESKVWTWNRYQLIIVDEDQIKDWLQHSN